MQGETMGAPTTQLAIDYKGKQYSGIYSVAGELMIVRIPGISSRSHEVGADAESTAREMLIDILKEADSVGTL
jgi:hypothetical protein